MDYSGYTRFPFPEGLSPQDEKKRQYFLSLPDPEQLDMLRGCQSYEQFYDRLCRRYDYSHTQA